MPYIITAWPRAYGKASAPAGTPCRRRAAHRRRLANTRSSCPMIRRTLAGTTSRTAARPPRRYSTASPQASTASTATTAASTARGGRVSVNRQTVTTSSQARAA
ncbi:hypothetical protein [Streptomyces sp. NPDC001661]